MENKVLRRTTLNGTKWEVVSNEYSVILYMGMGEDNYIFSGYLFSRLEEAIMHLDKIDERIRNPHHLVSQLDCNSFYGRGSNVYYGD